MTAKPARKIIRENGEIINRPPGKPSREALQERMRQRFPDANISAFDYITARKNRNRNKDWGASYPTEAEMRAADGPIRPQEAFVEIDDAGVLRLCRLDDRTFQRVLDGAWGSNWAVNARRLIGPRANFRAREEAENKPRDPFARQLDLD